MLVIFNQLKVELDKDLSKEQKALVEEMRKKGFLFTYYQGEDTHAKEGGSVKEVVMKLKERNKIKM